jgi:hypothetical protein
MLEAGTLFSQLHLYIWYNTMKEAKARYAHYLAEEMRVMRRNPMKTAFILILLIVTVFLLCVILV